MNNAQEKPREEDLVAEGFEKLDEHLMDRKAPKITFLQGFHDKADPQKILYLIRLASTMNHAAKLVSDERDELVKLMVSKEKQLESMAASLRQNSETLQSEVTRMNEQKQEYNAEIARLNQRIRELE